MAVVTSDFHMPRRRAIFQVTAALAGAALWQDPDRFGLPCLLIARTFILYLFASRATCHLSGRPAPNSLI